MAKLGLGKEEQDMITKEILHREAELNRKWRLKVTVRDFEPIAIIGKGAFGEVRLVRSKKSKDILAMKKMKKNEMISKNQVHHVKAERDVLTKATNKWIVDLKYSFQDDNHLYLVMEYLPGGDLMTLLIRKEILQEDEARFYMSEIVMAIESVHKLNYIHRDLKPDNVLIDKNGHIKLSDFGLCKHAEIKPINGDTLLKKQEGAPVISKAALEKQQVSNRRRLAYSTVGTPDYIAPEVFGQTGYNETVDWWSAGVILYEMLVGCPPFFSDDPSITCQKIIHWKKTLSIPSEANLSPASTDLIKKLICDPDHRLGKGGVMEIKMHPFFEGIDWDSLTLNKSPYIPNIKSETDTSNFDKFEEDKNNPFYPDESKKKKKKNPIDINFIGYTFHKECQEEKDIIMKAFEDPQFLRALQQEMVMSKEVSVHNIIHNSPPTHITSIQHPPPFINDHPNQLIKDAKEHTEHFISPKDSIQPIIEHRQPPKKQYQVIPVMQPKPHIQTVGPPKPTAVNTKSTASNVQQYANESKIQTPAQAHIITKNITLASQNNNGAKIIVPKYIPVQHLAMAKPSSKPIEITKSVPQPTIAKKPGK